MTSRCRALLFLGAVLAVAGGTLWAWSWERPSAPVSQSDRPAVVEQAAAVAPATAAEPKTPSGWLPLVALGAATVVGIGYVGRRAVRTVRASYAVKQRLVRAGRRAPPVCALAICTS